MTDIRIPTLQEYITLARTHGFARTDRFLVNFMPQSLLLKDTHQKISMMCEEATFPGKNIRFRSLRINTINEQRAHTVDYTGNIISFSFIVDSTWAARYFFEDWMALAVNPLNADSSREVGFYNEYIGYVDIYSLVQTQGENPEAPLFGIRLFEAWPTSIHAQPMSNGSQGYHRLRVDFTFKWWENQEISNAIAMNENAASGVNSFEFLKAKNDVINVPSIQVGPLKREDPIRPPNPLKYPEKPNADLFSFNKFGGFGNGQ